MRHWSWVHPLQERFETIETFAPEGAVEIEPLRDRRQRIRLGAIMSFAAGAAMAHELGALEHGEVLGDSRLRYAGKESEGVDGLFAAAGEVLEDGAAAGVGESAEDVICIGRRHEHNHNRLVMVCQAQKSRRVWELRKRLIKRNGNFFMMRGGRG